MSKIGRAIRCDMRQHPARRAIAKECEANRQLAIGLIERCRGWSVATEAQRELLLVEGHALGVSPNRWCEAFQRDDIGVFIWGERHVRGEVTRSIDLFHRCLTDAWLGRTVSGLKIPRGANNRHGLLIVVDTLARIFAIVRAVDEFVAFSDFLKVHQITELYDSSRCVISVRCR